MSEGHGERTRQQIQLELKSARISARHGESADIAIMEQDLAATTSKRERRRAKRALEKGPLVHVVGLLEQDGVQMERLSCGHITVALPPPAKATTGALYRHCLQCKQGE